MDKYGYLTLKDTCDMLGIEFKTIEELNLMSYEDRQKYFSEHCWSKGHRDEEPFKVFDLTKVEADFSGDTIRFIINV